MERPLDGKTAVMTVAGPGMGLATARLFHEHGANLVLADFSGAQEGAAKELGDRAVAIQADVRCKEDAKAMIELAESEFGDLNILCNVAGVVTTPMALFHESPEDDFDFMGPYLTMMYAIPSLLARGGGVIVAVASTAAVIGVPQRANYAASKAGLLGLTKSIALEYAEQNIRATPSVQERSRPPWRNPASPETRTPSNTSRTSFR